MAKKKAVKQAKAKAAPKAAKVKPKATKRAKARPAPKVEAEKEQPVEAPTENKSEGGFEVGPPSVAPTDKEKSEKK